MCTLAAAAIGATVLSTGMTMYGQYQQGRAQQSQMNYQAAVDRNNKIISDRAAEDAIKRGQAEEEKHRRQVQQVKAQQRVGFAARGIDLGSDNVLDTLSDTAMFGELDALTIRNNAAREAYGYQVQGMNYEASAANKVLAGKNARSAANTGMFTTLLSGASTVAESWQNYNAKGVNVLG
ncbi:MAG: hypothetical protein RBT70_08775 [Alphaproteobacteria bacterium]|jgi:hypothetical protein|nr:hypothetical protein [Alphaproteobacteria bacterium]